MRGLHTFATLPLSLRSKQTFKTNGDDANNSNDQTNKPSTWDIRHQWPTSRKTIQTETHRQHMTQISSNRREDVVVHRRGSSPQQPCRHDILTYSCGSMVSVHTNRLPTIMQRTCVREQQWPTHPRDSPNAEIGTTHDENADAVTYKTLIRVTFLHCVLSTRVFVTHATHQPATPCPKLRLS